MLFTFSQTLDSISNTVNLECSQFWNFSKCCVGHIHVLTHPRNSVFPGVVMDLNQPTPLVGQSVQEIDTTAKLGLLPGSGNKSPSTVLCGGRNQTGPLGLISAMSGWANPPTEFSQLSTGSAILESKLTKFKERVKNQDIFQFSSVTQRPTLCNPVTLNLKIRIGNYGIKIANATLCAVRSSIFRRQFLYLITI